MIKLSDVTRLEIIDESGRTFSRHDLDGVSIDGQDDGETLKIFLDYEGEDRNTTATVLYAALYQLTQEEDNRADVVEMIKEHLAELFSEEAK